MTQTSSPPARDLAPTVVEAVITVIARSGFDAASVRTVASEAGVSIGAVQHHFPTKDAMLRAASDEVAARIQSRVDGIDYGPDARDNLVRALSELLPLDTTRRRECRVHVAFAAAAATRAPLAAIERTVLRRVVEQVAQALSAAWGTTSDDPAVEPAARALVALADGLALHAVSTGVAKSAVLRAALERGVAAVLADGPAGTSTRRGGPSE